MGSCSTWHGAAEQVCRRQNGEAHRFLNIIRVEHNLLTRALRSSEGKLLCQPLNDGMQTPSADILDVTVDLARQHARRHC